jgi:hypothetical protein
MAASHASAALSTPNPAAGLCAFSSKKVAARACACNHLKTIVYASRDDSPQGPPAIALLKQTNLECSIFMMSPVYAMSMVGFGMLFIKKRFGGGALTATLASKMLKNAPADSASPFLSIIMKRVFGGRGSEAIGHSVRQELRHMIYQQPVCTYMRSLQVCCLLGAPSTCIFIRVFFFCRQKRVGASRVTAPPLIRNRQRGQDCFQQTHSTPASALRLRTCT